VAAALQFPARSLLVYRTLAGAMLRNAIASETYGVEVSFHTSAFAEVPRRRACSLRELLRLGGPIARAPGLSGGSLELPGRTDFSLLASHSLWLPVVRRFVERLSSGHSCGSSTYLQERVFKSFP